MLLQYVASFKAKQMIGDLISGLGRPPMALLQQVNLVLNPQWCANGSHEQEGERSVWLEGKYSSALADHPMAKYGYVNRVGRQANHRKSIVDPDRVAFFAIHDGRLLNRKERFDDAAALEAAANLGFEFLHLVNLYRCREWCDKSRKWWTDEHYQAEEFKQEPEWRWVLQ